jgi:hypothetical protein
MPPTEDPCINVLTGPDAGSTSFTSSHIRKIAKVRATTTSTEKIYPIIEYLFRIPNKR